MDKKVIIYASQDNSKTPIYINILKKGKDFEKIKIPNDQAMRLVAQLSNMLQYYIKD
jgi:hypothetical protein